ncbi:hypothetical protein EDC56_1071 [Sinobacterium caligoides]|uniref:Uncharacterized protein n=1 Tax=Sinobacterium caligoides TaxID=933926 RepID=A0A3N2E0B3_9GAMM|nr:hypothetical protein [Sinobacterium caligoides]ROS05536.1 hypothetical protein EDC56_1071 [Sinobacterium caligoides]
MKRMIIEGLKWISILYFFLCLLSLSLYIIADLPSFEEVGHLKHGCYKTDALVPYVACKGYELNTLVRYSFNLWYQPVYGIFFLLAFPIGTLYGLAVWAPGIYLVWYWLRGRHLTKRVMNALRAGQP